jgi:Uma2 family endonuclease
MEMVLQMNAALKLATYQDVLDAPPHVVAELIQGMLHTMPRPGPKHSRAAGRTLTSLDDPFDFGRSGPGGWLILSEPELHLRNDILVPDIAGWRRERMPKLPETAFFDLAPDWVCEVLSPSTARFDRAVKMPIYAQAGVGFLWLIEPISRTLEVYALQPGKKWLLVDTFAGEESVHPVPFDAVAFALSDLWAE